MSRTTRSTTARGSAASTDRSAARSAKRPALAASALLLIAVSSAACSAPASSNEADATSPAGTATSAGADAAGAAADCPTDVLDVVVSVDQWGSIVSDLAGDCGDVHTVLASSSVDPHDYEPSPSDANTFSDAELVVVNGADYDPWASDITATIKPAPPVVDAGKVVGTTDGANPHLWYSPDYVGQVADAVTAELKELAPDAADYLDQRNADWKTSMAEYDSIVAALKTEAAGKTYGATESVFDYMAEATGLTNATPQGYQNAAANEADPAPADIDAFQTALAGGDIDVLIYNTQTEGSIPEQIRSAAEDGGVPVVEVTETVAPGSDTFADWQVSQLKLLAEALGVSV